ncbi:MAG: polyphosphate kinase 1 [Ruminococcus sp.]|nr:polyphosphate kinase 1 [Ruminococcus sp.]
MGKKVYDNRELSWLKFNVRVLEEARDNNVPLMERLLFESIFESNLDEFFMVRVGSLIDQSLVDDNQKDGKTKMRPSEQLSAIYSKIRELNEKKDKTYSALLKELSLNKVYHKQIKSLSKPETEFLESYYAYEIKPFLNAVVVDKRHPFPFLNNKEIYAVGKLNSKSGVKLGLISCGEKFERVIFLPAQNEDEISFVLAEELILHFADKAFDKYKFEEKALMRITRNADINIEESFDDELDFRQNMSVLINKRKRLCPVRLQLSKNLSDLTCAELCARLELTKKQVFIEKAPLDFSFVFPIFKKAENKKHLFFNPQQPQMSPAVMENVPMISQIDNGDIFLSYPYESMKPFIRLLEEAAADPTVVSIKMTLYRVAKNSKVIKALCAAAENGKDVLVLVELRARFDEENNIGWSKLLEDSGCNVMYGPQGLKVHSKLCLITRKVGKSVKYTVQVGTGNYNEKTAELYTDLCLMTANEEIAHDAVNVFNSLAIGELVEDSKQLLVAPKCLQNKIVEMMDKEIAIAKAGGEAYVGAKLNSLTDKVLIDKIIECSQAGVKVELVIRGISCLVAGIKGKTDNVRIVSIVGRYLEHARIYIFGMGERQKVYISSADYMTRNTMRRVEVAAPILDESIRKRIIDYFNTQLSDNVKAREQHSDGTYKWVPTEGLPIDAQKRFFDEAYENAPKPDSTGNDRKEKKGILARILGIFKRKNK